ncbi:MAG: Rap1a/Tai family immunity protein [Aliarcobacter sp.]|nr:Rap1a/Tai family immunity protein [Aliarcobacter sp.]
MTGSELKECYYTSPSFCDGFTMGIVTVGVQAGIIQPLPKKVTVPQIIAIVKKYLKEHPESLHEEASNLILLSLSKTFDK